VFVIREASCLSRRTLGRRRKVRLAMPKIATRLEQRVRRHTLTFGGCCQRVAASSGSRRSSRRITNTKCVMTRHAALAAMDGQTQAESGVDCASARHRAEAYNPGTPAARLPSTEQAEPAARPVDASRSTKTHTNRIPIASLERRNPMRDVVEKIEPDKRDCHPAGVRVPITVLPLRGWGMR
jgi:hypothetical protein